MDALHWPRKCESANSVQSVPFSWTMEGPLMADTKNRGMAGISVTNWSEVVNNAIHITPNLFNCSHFEVFLANKNLLLLMKNDFSKALASICCQKCMTSTGQKSTANYWLVADDCDNSDSRQERAQVAMIALLTLKPFLDKIEKIFQIRNYKNISEIFPTNFFH